MLAAFADAAPPGGKQASHHDHDVGRGRHPGIPGQVEVIFSPIAASIEHIRPASCVRITHATAQQMIVRGLIERDHAAMRYAVTDQGRAVLGALLR